jgi:hypothetical protein
MNRIPIPFLLVGAVAFIVYLLTLAPTITWRNEGVDSGDLAAAVAVGGVPHPPGYPTYLLLGGLFANLPYGDIAYRLNLLSAVCAALAVMLIALSLAQILPALPSQPAWLPALCAASTAFILAFSDLFWSQAIIAEVYALNALFVGLLLYGALLVRSTGKTWLIPLLFGLLGLGLGNHPSLLFVSPLLLSVLGLRWLRPTAFSSILAFVAGLSIYIIIPLRAAGWPPINWGGAVNGSNFLWLVTAHLYHQFLFALPGNFIPARLFSLALLLAKSFLGWGLPVSLLGLRRLFVEDRSLAQGSVATFGVVTIYSVSYNTSDSYVYLLPALMLFALWLGWGLYELLYQLFRSPIPVWDLESWHRLVIVGLIILPFLSLSFNFSTQNLSQDNEAYLYAQQALQEVAQEAIIITEADSQTFALWYVRYGLGVRPDLAVINSQLLGYDWYHQTIRHTHPALLLADESDRPITKVSDFITLNSPQVPIYLTSAQIASDFPLVEVGPLFRLDIPLQVQSITSTVQE